jgi:hypothetical protein
LIIINDCPVNGELHALIEALSLMLVPLVVLSRRLVVLLGLLVGMLDGLVVSRCRVAVRRR